MSLKAMIIHSDYINFHSSISLEYKEELFQEIRGMIPRMRGILGFFEGENVSPEIGMDKGYSDGFIIILKNVESRDNYLEDPEHQATDRKLVEAAVGGLQGILVYDLQI